MALRAMGATFALLLSSSQANAAMGLSQNLGHSTEEWAVPGPVLPTFDIRNKYGFVQLAVLDGLVSISHEDSSRFGALIGMHWKSHPAHAFNSVIQPGIGVHMQRQNASGALTFAGHVQGRFGLEHKNTGIYLVPQLGLSWKPRQRSDWGVMAGGGLQLSFWID